MATCVAAPAHNDSRYEDIMNKNNWIDPGMTLGGLMADTVIYSTPDETV